MEKLFILTLIAVLISCGTHKKNESKIEMVNNNLTGLFMGEIIPADIGKSYRVYLNFSVDSVWVANFSSECVTAHRLIKNSYDNKAKINQGNPMSFSFESVRLTFVENKEVEKKYVSQYKCIYQSIDSLKFEVSNYWFDGKLFLRTIETYYPCE